MAKTLRVRTKAGWVTKPAADLPENRLTSEEVDDNFLAIEGALETHVGDSGIHVDSTVVRTTGNQTIGGVKTFSSTIAGSINGAAGSAATLTTARTINGTSFDGGANITTANWGTNRTLTIGNTGKTVNGSGNVSWSINEVTNAGSPGDSYAAWGNGVQVGVASYPATGTAIASFVASNNRGIQLATIAYDVTDSLKFRRIHTGETNGVGPWVDLVDTTIDQTIAGTKTFSSTIAGSINGNAATVTNGVYTTGNQTIGGTKTFSSTIAGSINGNAATVTNGVYTTGNQTITGIKTLTSPVLTGTPTAPTAPTATNTTQIATTAYVKAQGFTTSSGVTSVGGTAPIVSSGGTTPTISITAASQLEAEVGNENTKLMTPLRVAQSFNSRHGNFGNFKIEYNAASDSLDFNYIG